MQKQTQTDTHSRSRSRTKPNNSSTRNGFPSAVVAKFTSSVPLADGTILYHTLKTVLSQVVRVGVQGSGNACDHSGRTRGQEPHTRLQRRRSFLGQRKSQIAEVHSHSRTSGNRTVHACSPTQTSTLRRPVSEKPSTQVPHPRRDAEEAERGRWVLSSGGLVGPWTPYWRMRGNQQLASGGRRASTIRSRTRSIRNFSPGSQYITKSHTRQRSGTRYRISQGSPH